MKRTLLVSCILIAAILLSACGRSAITPRAHTATPVPELNVTRLPPTISPTTLAASDTPLPPTASPLPPTATSTATVTLTPTATQRPATRVRATPTSSGPLSVVVYVASCQRAPTTGKSSNVIIQISIEASGGTGDYRYFVEGVEATSRFVDITWERGTRLIGTVRVTSGESQSVTKHYDIPTGELTCN